MPDLTTFFQVFIPLFVTIDPLGLVPLFLTVTGGMSDERRRRVSFEAVASATVICLSFMFLGHAVFRFLGITVNDFRIAGGIILLVLAVLDLVMHDKPAMHVDEMVGIVPLGMPLIAGPATLTTILVLAGRHGYWWTALSLAVNFLLLLGVLLGSRWIARLVGANALRALSKLVMVFLAAIAVNFIRVGVMESLAEWRKAGGG